MKVLINTIIIEQVVCTYKFETQFSIKVSTIVYPGTSNNNCGVVEGIRMTQSIMCLPVSHQSRIDNGRLDRSIAWEGRT